jgi:hypothetical protein
MDGRKGDLRMSVLKIQATCYWCDQLLDYEIVAIAEVAKNGVVDMDLIPNLRIGITHDCLKFPEAPAYRVLITDDEDTKRLCLETRHGGKDYSLSQILGKRALALAKFDLKQETISELRTKMSAHLNVSLTTGTVREIP